MKQIIAFYFIVFILFSCNNKKTQECDIESINKLAFENLSSFMKDGESNKLDISIDSFKRTLSCDSTNIYALQYISLSYSYRKDFLTALYFNEKAIKNTRLPEFFTTQRGSIYELAGNQDSSKYYFEQGLKIYSNLESKYKDSIEIKVQIINLLNKLERKELAIEKLNHYIKEYPNNELLNSMNSISNK